MLRKILDEYIEATSILEKYRGIIAIYVILLIFSLTITSLVGMYCIFKILLSVLLISIIVCIIIRIVDYCKITNKKNPLKLIFNYKEYQNLIFKKIKLNIKEVLDKDKKFNLETIDILIDAYSKKNTEKKNDFAETLKWIYSTFISIITLGKMQQAVVLAFGISVISFLVTKFILDFALDCILTNKINYELIYEALIELKIEIVNYSKDKDNHTHTKNN